VVPWPSNRRIYGAPLLAIPPIKLLGGGEGSVVVVAMWSQKFYLWLSEAVSFLIVSSKCPLYYPLKGLERKKERIYKGY
jgi:hypothetical protein